MTFYIKIKHAYFVNAELVPLQGVELKPDERHTLSFKPSDAPLEFTLEWKQIDLALAASFIGMAVQFARSRSGPTCHR